jgi:hypothetical protein
VNKRYGMALVVVSQGWLAFGGSRPISRRDMVATKPRGDGEKEHDYDR